MDIPLLKSKKREAKQLIVEALSRRWPLTAKQAHKLVSREDGGFITYQGVHKCLEKLLADGIVEEGASGYKLSRDWVSGVKEFGAKTEQAYKAGAPAEISSLEAGETRTFKFSSFMEAVYWFTEEDYAEFLATKEPDVCIVLWRHLWPVTQVSAELSEKIRALFSTGTHVGLIRFDSPLDRFLQGYWEKLGKKFLLGVRLGAVADVIVTRDYYFEFFLPEDARRRVDAVFRRSKGRSDANLAEYCKLVSSKDSATLVRVMRNADACRQVAEQAMPYFNGKKK